MNIGSTATNGTARVNGSQAKCSQMSKKGSNANHVSHTTQNGDLNKRQDPGHITALSQKLRERSLSASSLTPRSHQRSLSADFCQCGAPPTITVRKSVKEPQPPQRGVSLLRPHTASRSSSKRNSCPPIGISRSPNHSSSSSSSISSISSCTSPPPVKTSDITGPDPLGWKLRPKNDSTSRQDRVKRLSLQIPLPITLPDLKSSPDSSPANQPNPTPGSKPALKPKPSRRRHSETSAFLRSLANPIPVVTLEELCNVHLRSVTYVDESDDVFSEVNDEEEQKENKVTTLPCKTPPPVAEKTAMARQIAQLIAHSRQRQHR